MNFLTNLQTNRISREERGGGGNREEQLNIFY